MSWVHQRMDQNQWSGQRQSSMLWNLIKCRDFFCKKLDSFCSLWAGFINRWTKINGAASSSLQWQSSMLCTCLWHRADRNEGRGGCRDTVGTHRQGIRAWGHRLKPCVKEWRLAAADQSKASLQLRKRRGRRLMVGEGRLSMGCCYERIFIGLAWCGELGVGAAGAGGDEINRRFDLGSVEWVWGEARASFSVASPLGRNTRLAWARNNDDSSSSAWAMWAAPWRLGYLSSLAQWPWWPQLR
jgi:hypothetical protein